MKRPNSGWKIGSVRALKTIRHETNVKDSHTLISQHAVDLARILPRHRALRHGLEREEYLLDAKKE
jgi:hypothetical protein